MLYFFDDTQKSQTDTEDKFVWEETSRNPTSSFERLFKLLAVPACLTVILDRNQESNYIFRKNGFDVKLVSAVTYKIAQQKFISTRELSLLLCA